jgi:hypothetical protein
MGPAFYIMAILGCGEGDAACEQVATTDTHYESVEACNAATPAAVEQHMDLAFPVVVAQCRRADAKVAAKVVPAQIDLPEPDQQPRVQRAVYIPPRKGRI